MQVDLGQNYSVGKVILKLPPSTAWAARTADPVACRAPPTAPPSPPWRHRPRYTFDPNANNNTVTITFPAATARYVRVNITANTGWNAAQLSDLEVFPSS